MQTVQSTEQQMLDEEKREIIEDIVDESRHSGGQESWLSYSSGIFWIASALLILFFVFLWAKPWG